MKRGCYIRTEKIRKKASEKLIGHKISEATKKKISQANKVQWVINHDKRSRLRDKEISYFVNENGCHICTSHCGKYPRMKRNGEKITLSHYVYEKMFGKKIPDGMLACHTCDNPMCINPEHIFPGTTLDNALDMLNKNRANPAKGEKSGQSKLTEDQVLTIRKDTRGLEELSKIYRVSKDTIWQARTKRSWKHI